MKKLSTLLLLSLLLILSNALAVEHKAAGTVLYFKSGGEIYLLMADHVDDPRGWTAFGGGAEEGESPAETAARETEEETRGYFSKEMILKKIKNKKPVFDDPYAFYFIKVDFVPAQRIANNEIPPDNVYYQERGSFAWIPYSELKAYLEKDIDEEGRYPINPKYVPADAATDYYWALGLRNLRKAITLHKLPWKP